MDLHVVLLVQLKLAFYVNITGGIAKYLHNYQTYSYLPNEQKYILSLQNTNKYAKPEALEDLDKRPGGTCKCES